MVPFQLLSYIFYAAAVLLLFYRVFWKEASNLYALAAAIVAAFLLFSFENVSMPLLLSGVVISNSISFTGERKIGMLVVLLGIAYAAFYVFYAQGAMLLAQSIFIGLIAYPKQFRAPSGARENKDIEKKRDTLQTAFGIAIIAAFVLLSSSKAYAFLILFILFGYLIKSFTAAYGKNPLAKYLAGLERQGAPFGRGAIWLALGSFLALSFVSPVKFVIPVLSAILIADPMATFVGIRVGGVKIPYNRDKTISGFIAYFLIVFTVSFLFVRQLSILIALIAAVVESLPMHIDDNFDVPLVLAILLKLVVP